MGATIIICLASAAFVGMLLASVLLRGQGPGGLQLLLTPIALRLARRGGTDLARELEWAKVGTLRDPAAWMAMRVIVPAAAAIFGFVFVGLGSGNTNGGLLFALIGAGIGYLYPRVYLSGRLKRRQALISRDVPRFLGAYARALAVRAALEALGDVNQMAETERERRRVLALGNNLDVAASRGRSENPYGSALWDGLAALMRTRQTGMVAKNASREHPDPLLSFAIVCNDRYIDRFVEMLRSALLQNRELPPETVERLIATMNEERTQNLKREAAAAQGRATFVLVVFNLPLLLLAVIAPPVAGVLLGGR